MIPKLLSDWDYDAISSLCDNGLSESETHDFKASLKGLHEPEKVCCAFANSHGGFIVIGIGRELTGLKLLG